MLFVAMMGLGIGIKAKNPSYGTDFKSGTAKAEGLLYC